MFYTKFTTIFPTIDIEKKYDVMFHGAGSSYLKNTDLLIDTWCDQDLPNLTIVCYDRCYRNLTKYVDKKHLDDLTKCNINMIDRQPYEKLVQMKNEYGYHLCPSMIEGWGHYLNEARIVSAVVLTIDAPPMNELINQSCGILIPYTKKIKRTNGTFMYMSDKKNLTIGLQKMLKMTDKERMAMGERARLKYEDDTKFFDQRIEELCNNIKMLIG